MTTLTRRRRPSDDMPDEERNTPRRSRRTRDEDEEPREERPARRSRRSSDEEDERPTRSRRSSRSRDEEEDERTRRRGADKGTSRSRRSGTGGYSAYQKKRRSSSKFADEFKPDANSPTLIKFLDAEPFDVYNQHWINEMPKGERKSYVCRDDEDYFSDDDGCPLCEIGDGPSTFALYNILDLSNPRKPEVKVWKTSVTVTDELERIGDSDRTGPLDREDIYFEVTMKKTKNRTTWAIEPVKARDLKEDFDIDPLDADELADFDDDKFNDRTAVTQVDSYDDLLDLAESLD